jgi:3,4-dihydroxy 2-butanone 4-phosphate synthase/GTP cyclohydrolase II
LLTNNPRKLKGLIDGNIEVRHVPHEIEPTGDSISYLKTKKDKLNHLFKKYI